MVPLETASDTMLVLCFLLFSLPLVSVASPLENPFGFLSGKDEKGPTDPVSLELPYGIFKSEYDEDSDMSVPHLKISAARNLQNPQTRLQEHTLRGSSGGRATMGQARSSGE